jgi:hypothetical protein
LQVLAHGFCITLQLFLFFLGKLRVFLGADGFVVVQWYKCESGRRLDNTDAAFSCAFLDFPEYFFLVFVEFLFDGLAPCPVVFAFERSRYDPVGLLGKVVRVAVVLPVAR